MLRELLGEIDRNPSRRKLRELSLVLLAGFGVMALGFHFIADRDRAATSSIIAGVALGLLALLPGVGRAVYVAWMSLGAVIGSITSPIVLFAGWALVLVPLGLALRATGWDPMKRKLGGTSYWEPHDEPSDPASYFRQF